MLTHCAGALASDLLVEPMNSSFFSHRVPSMANRSAGESRNQPVPNPWHSSADSARIQSVFGKSKRYLRWSDWALSRIPLLCMVGSYLALVHGRQSMKSLADFLLFTFVFASSNSAFGFLINDLGDRELDRRHAKRNTFLEIGTTKAGYLLAAVIALMVLSGLPFLGRPYFASLWALWWLAAIAYSLPPLRLKERGAVGIAATSVAGWTLPVAIAFAALEAGTAWELWMFLLATTVSGATLELAHQRHDLPNDANTKTGTLAVNLGQRKIDKIYLWALWADRIAVGIVLFMVIFRSQDFELKVNGPAVLAASLIFIYVAALLNMSGRLIKGDEVDPYYGQRTTSDRILHDIMPNFLIPAFLLTQLTLQSPIWSTALLVFLFWRLLLPRLN
jgi:4-hydroxybenzoate polyprenyltransferase